MFKPMNKQERIRQLLAIWVGCTYDQVVTDIKAAKDQLGISPPKRKKRTEEHYIHADQFTFIISGISDAFRDAHFQSVIRMILHLLLSTGIRIGECLAIKLQDLNLQERMIVLEKTKGSKSRTVVFDQDLAQLMALYLQQLPAGQVFLFEKRKAGIADGQYTTRAIQAALKRLRERVGEQHGIDLSHVTPHAFRHTYATDMYHALPTTMLKGQLGHTSIATTERTYVEDNPILIRQALDAYRLTKIHQ